MISPKSMFRTNLATTIGNVFALFALSALLVAPFALKAQTAGEGTITGIVKDSSGAEIPGATVMATNVATNVSETRMTSGDAPAASGCAQPAGYGYATPSYASRYGVRMVRPRVMEEQPRIYEERRVVRRHGRSTGRSIAIVAGSAGAALRVGAIAGASGGFAYDRLTHNR